MLNEAEMIHEEFVKTSWSLYDLGLLVTKPPYPRPSKPTYQFHMHTDQPSNPSEKEESHE